jgi:hypothetical protein
MRAASGTVATALYALALGLGSTLARAQVYKCLDADGKITSQQTPCGVNSTKGKVKNRFHGAEFGAEGAAPILSHVLGFR